MLRRFLNILLISGVLSLLVGCGDIFTSEKEKELNYNQFAVCENDFEALSKIMTRDVSAELNCLQSNLILFMNLAEGKTTKPGYLSEEDLLKFIGSNFSDIDADQLNILSGVFDINTILFGDEPRYIARANIEKLTELLININELMVNNKIYKYFTADERMNYIEHRKRKTSIYKTLEAIGLLISNAYVENDRSLVLKDFLLKFQNTDNKEIIEKAGNLLFTKKTILGGDEKTLKGTELRRMSGMLSDIGKVVYDFTNLPDTDISEEDDEEIIRSLKEGVETVEKNLYYAKDSKEPIFSFDDVDYIVNEFFPEVSKFLKYKSTFLNAKKVFLGNNSEIFTAGEIEHLIKDFLYKNLNRGVYFYRAYKEHKVVLNSSTSIKEDFVGVPNLTEQDKVSSKEFNRIAQKYNFFKGSNYTPIFDSSYGRNVRAMFEISIYEDIAHRVFELYGSKKKGNSEVTLNIEELGDVMIEFSDLLVGEGFIQEGRARNTAETITLMAGLFHSQSDGTGNIEVAEFVEFITTMLSSLHLSDSTHEFLQANCSIDSEGRYDAQCFRDRTEDIFEIQAKKSSDKNIGNYLPELRAYLNDLSHEDKNKFLSSIASFSRACSFYDNGQEAPMKQGDTLVVWAGLLTIEQSIIRFDTNKSSELEPSEVSEAFKVYKEAIVAMIPAGFLRNYSKEFFKYMIKYNRIPDVPDVTGFRSLWKALREGSHFVKFLFMPNSSQAANADRMTFATVLKIISENSPSRTNNPYDCRALK